MALERGEVVEDAGRGRGGAGAVFGVERQVGDLLAGHRVAQFALDQAAAQQRDELAGEQCFDAGGALERDRRGVLDGLQLVVAFLEVGLVAVGDQDLGVGELVVVGDQREAAVGGGVVADRVGVDVGVDLEAGLGELAVAGVLAGAAALLLAVALLGGLGDLEGD